jgi:hypothetical protein
MRLDERGRCGEQRGVVGIRADAGQRRQLFERLLERNGG